MEHPLLYEINTRCWLAELSARRGQPITLANVPPSEFQPWLELGFTHIWLMGVWSSGPIARARALESADLRARYSEALPGWTEADVHGSTYAIGAYRVPEDLGGEAGLGAFREALHAHGLKLILDFVPNHLGMDHPWIGERPTVFVQAGRRTSGFFKRPGGGKTIYLAHGRDPNFTPWNDTVQIEYRSAENRRRMICLLEEVAARCDGVRCDMAMLLLNEVFQKTWKRVPAPEPPPQSEFWTEAIGSVRRAHPDFLFLAEVYWGLEPRLQQLGFDFTYDKGLYDQLMARNGPGVLAHLSSLKPEVLARGAHFLENHDEARVASVLSPQEQRAAALVILGLPGMRFLHEGQLHGWKRRLPVQLARRGTEAPTDEIWNLYHQLLRVVADSAVGRGKATLLAPRAAWEGNPTAGNFVLVQWQSEETALDLVAVNLAPHRSQALVALPLPASSPAGWQFADRLGAESFTRSDAELRQKGLFLDLDAQQAQVLHVKPAAS